MSKNYKKEIKEAIKRKIDKDVKFKDFYSSLSVKEKEELKKRFSDFQELRNSIIKHNTLSKEELQSVAIRLLDQNIKNKGYKKTHGKKASVYAKNRKFIFRYRDEYWIGVKPLETTKKGFKCHTLFLVEVLTEKGKIYIEITGNNQEEKEFSIIAYTAHFFDRYKERLSLKGNRDEVIEVFVKDELSKKKGTGITRDDEGNCYYDLCEGLALGKDMFSILLNKTFISKDEINNFQKKRKKELSKIVDDMFDKENNKN